MPFAKVVPPLVDDFVARPRLDACLADVLMARITILRAGAGYGKSALLSRWAVAHHAAWYSLDQQDRDLTVLAVGFALALDHAFPGVGSELAGAASAAVGPDLEVADRAYVLASVAAESLSGMTGPDVLLIFDNVGALQPNCSGTLFLDALCRHLPRSVHLALASREEPPLAVGRMRAEGDVVDLGPSELRFDASEIAVALKERFDGREALAHRLQELTDGRPSAVCAALRRLAREPAVKWQVIVEEVARLESGPAAGHSAELLDILPPAVADLLARLSCVGEFTVALCDALGLSSAAECIPELLRRGLLVEVGRSPEQWYALSADVQQNAEGRFPLDEGLRVALVSEAAEWYERHGRPDAAIEALLGARDLDGVVRLLASHGPELVAGGKIMTVIAAGDAVDDGQLDGAAAAVVAQARQIQGDWQGAMRLYQTIARGAGDLPAGVAWRMGLIEYMQGRADEALSTFGRGRYGDADGEDDMVMLLAWQSTVHWLRGDAKRCGELAREAHDLAENNPQPGALAAAHTALALAASLSGDRHANAQHYEIALLAAQEAGDALQGSRILTNLGSHHLEEGQYEQSVQRSEAAISLASSFGFRFTLAIALSNRAEARFELGFLDEAVSDLILSSGLLHHSTRACAPLAALGDVLRTRGELATALIAYDEALQLAEEGPDVHALVRALAGRARIVAADDPDEAANLIHRAQQHVEAMTMPSALLAGGWLALAGGNSEAALKAARDAAHAAHQRRDRLALTESVELEALATPDRAGATALISAAVAMWTELGSPLRAANAQLALARISTDDDTSNDRRAEGELARFGIRPQAAAALGLLAAVGRQFSPGILIETLGLFRVVRAGVPVPTAAWQSKKARDLLKILIAYRGRPVPRRLLGDALWPEDTGDLSNRVSVALSTARMVLDPGRRHPTNHFISAARETVVIRLEHLQVDVERFFGLITQGHDLERVGRRDEALDAWAAAETLYAGDFLESDPYDDWAASLRDEARAAYIAISRRLAMVADECDDPDTAIRYHLRILERDPYDEDTHLRLVACLRNAGRHGEARRHYRAYTRCMEDLDAEPAAFPL